MLFPSHQSFSSLLECLSSTLLRIHQPLLLPDKLIVQFHPEIHLSPSTLTTRIASLDRSLSQLNVLKASRLNNFDQSYVLKLPQNADIISAVEKLKADPAVIYAEPDYLAQLAETPDDPYFDQQWGLEKIQAEVAWDVTLGSPNIVIDIYLFWN